MEDEQNKSPVTTRQVKQLYERPPSFTDLLPWMEYNPASRTFLLEDGISVGALFEITPAGTEARTLAFMTQLRDAIQTALTDARDPVVLFSTSSLFERAATRAVLKFKYKPRVVDGVPVDVPGVKTRITFQIED